MDRPCVWNLALIQFLENQLTAKNSEKNDLWAPQDVLFGMACQFQFQQNVVGIVLLSLTNDLQMSIINSLSLIKLETLSPPKKIGIILEKFWSVRPPLEGLPLPFTNHPIKLDIVRGPIVYIFHYFTLMYNFVRFWSCTLMYIGFHQENKTKLG